MAQGEQTTIKKTLADFLETTPPYVLQEITQLVTIDPSSGSSYLLLQPTIRLHCDVETCQGTRFFDTDGSKIWITSEGWRDCFIEYACRNCGGTFKTFALSVQRKASSNAGEAFKYGEQPQFGPPTPARVISLIGPDRELFLQGRRAENQGFGIGSFAYYRRVVENQKGRIEVPPFAVPIPL